MEDLRALWINAGGRQGGKGIRKLGKQDEAPGMCLRTEQGDRRMRQADSLCCVLKKTKCNARSGRAMPRQKRG